MQQRIAIRLKDCKTIEGWADERYRGGPDNPLSDSDVEAKAYSCCEGNLDNAGQSALIDAAWSVLQLKDAGKLMALMNRLK